MVSLSLLAPIAYSVVVIGALVTFSRIYRKRSAARQIESWFPSHPERDVYITLLQQDPPPSDQLLKAALLRRAVTDVQRIIRIRDDKTALTALLQKGSIGDDLWTSFQAAEKELEAEILEVVAEANTFREGWGGIIFQTASEIVQNEKHRDIYISIPQRKTEYDQKYATKTPAVTVTAPTAPTSAPKSPITVAQGLATPTEGDYSGSSAPSSQPGSPMSMSTPLSPGKAGSAKKNKKRK